ncbi:hypothetical protein [Pseudomonas sp. ML96]|uniref:hypothetical protein n=1 Tax=Pseudomonas sp. ML96 TaxID=1523503 RepID=UPI0005BE3027|nr:hypothetical protein [Pseudomonas sp. ML96]
MQLFINYWSTALTVAATAEATQLSVAPGEAAKLTGLGGEAYYLLTLVERDPTTQVELRREIVKATAVSGALVTVARDQEASGAQVWDAGALIEARVTAGTLQQLQNSTPGGGGVTSVEAGDGIEVDSTNPAAPVVALSADMLNWLNALDAQVAVLTGAVAGLIPPDSVLVTAGRVDSGPDTYQVGYFRGWPAGTDAFGSLFPDTINLPGVGGTAVSMAKVLQMEEGAEFYVALLGDQTAHVSAITSLEVQGIGTLDVSTADIGVYYDTGTNQTEIGWTIGAHDWAEGLGRTVTFTFAP